MDFDSLIEADSLKVREVGRNEFGELVDSVISVVGKLPQLDYAKLHQELRDSPYLHIKISEDPSLDELSKAVLKVQMAKDRVAQILLDAERNAKIMKHYAKALYTAWVRLSGDSSQDKRESDASTRVWDFSGLAAEAEALQNAAKSVLDNLKDKWDTISRSVFITELRWKMGEVGGNTPFDRLTKK